MQAQTKGLWIIGFVCRFNPLPWFIKVASSNGQCSICLLPLSQRARKGTVSFGFRVVLVCPAVTGCPDACSVYLGLLFRCSWFVWAGSVSQLPFFGSQVFLPCWCKRTLPKQNVLGVEIQPYDFQYQLGRLSPSAASFYVLSLNGIA